MIHILEGYDFVSDHYSLKLTDNLRKIFDEWSGLSNCKIEIYNIKDCKEKKNDFGWSHFIDGSVLKIYVSEYYPEALLIHEILHYIMQYEGYPCIKSMTYCLFTELLSNALEHLIIGNRIKTYDLDFIKWYKVLSEHKILSYKQPIKGNLGDFILDEIYMGINSLEDDFYGKYRDELLDTLKTNDEEIYEYRQIFNKIVEETPYLTIDGYHNLLNKIVNEIETIHSEKIFGPQIHLHVIKYKMLCKA